MSDGGIRFVPFSPREDREDAPPRPIQELWFTLAQRPWSSLVIVPADESVSASSIATSLADVGSRLSSCPVNAIVADRMDFESARILADLQLRVRFDGGPPEPNQGLTIDVRPSIVTPPPAPSVRPGDVVAEPGGTEADGAEAEAAGTEAGAPRGPPPRYAALMPPAGKVVVAIQPVLVEPLGIATAQAADQVLVCVGLGKTRLKSVRRTLELIGARPSVAAVLIR
jgi:hypothetical protein